MKKLFVIFFVLIANINFSSASEETISDTVYLKPTEIYLLDVPAPIEESVDFANKYSVMTRTQYENESYGIDSDEEVFDSKLGKTFVNILNKTVVNNKYSKIPSQIHNINK